MEERIDIVIPWVDSSDSAWRKEKNKYAQIENHPELIDDSEARFRDWGTVKYLLRSIEKYTPWVNKVYFITWGHIPKWMNVKSDKLIIVKHEEYIPEVYLPTFCSHVIELNLHRIPGLSERFIYLNDDHIIMNEMDKSCFFKNGLPRDYAILSPINTRLRNGVQDVALTDVEVINDHFKKKDVIRRNFFKWVNPVYGKELFRSFCMMPWPYFTGFFTRHQSTAYLKSTFEELWDIEYQTLDRTCRHRFRSRRDVNQWVIRYWQMANGNFMPIRPFGKNFTINNDNKELLDEIDTSKELMICINEDRTDRIVDFEKTKSTINSHLELKFHKKSSFEL